MRAVIQRVRKASVSIADKVVGEIGVGLCIFIGIETTDTTADAAWLAQKIVHLRLFADERGIPNIDLLGANAALLVVSQFTLFASYKKGNRPAYLRAARPETAVPLYEYFIAELEKESGKKVEKGVFGADMQVLIQNDGPLTILIDTQNKE